VDYVAYGLSKYLWLALKANPSVLLALFAPDSHTRVCSPEGAALRTLAPAIASKRAYGAFMGYMGQQTERLRGTRGQRNVTRPELVQAYGFDTKYAGHIVRLGYQGEELLRTGRITLPMPRQAASHRARRAHRQVHTGASFEDARMFDASSAKRVRRLALARGARRCSSRAMDDRYLRKALVDRRGAIYAAWPFKT
jgi:hypothetical protein